MTEAISKYASAMTMLRHCDEKCACPEQLVVMTNLGVLKFGEGMLLIHLDLMINGIY